MIRKDIIYRNKSYYRNMYLKRVVIYFSSTNINAYYCISRMLGKNSIFSNQGFKVRSVYEYTNRKLRCKYITAYCKSFGL